MKDQVLRTIKCISSSCSVIHEIKSVMIERREFIWPYLCVYLKEKWWLKDLHSNCTCNNESKHAAQPVQSKCWANDSYELLFFSCFFQLLNKRCLWGFFFLGYHKYTMRPMYCDSRTSQISLVNHTHKEIVVIARLNQCSYWHYEFWQ